MKKPICLFLTCLLTVLPATANNREKDTQLETLIRLEKQLKREAAAYNSLECLRYVSLAGILAGVGLGSATLTMGTLDLFASEQQRNTFTVSTVVILSASILLGLTTHAAAKRQYDSLLLSTYDYYDYMETNSEYFKGELR